MVSPPLALSTRQAGVRAPCQAVQLYHSPLSPVHPAPLPGQELHSSLRTQLSHYSPHMQTNWDGTNTAQQNHCPQRALKQGRLGATAGTSLHPAVGLQCAMALTSQDTGSPSLCQPLLSAPHPQALVMQKDPLAKTQVWATAQLYMDRS